MFAPLDFYIAVIALMQEKLQRETLLFPIHEMAARLAGN